MSLLTRTFFKRLQNFWILVFLTLISKSVFAHDVSKSHSIPCITDYSFITNMNVFRPTKDVISLSFLAWNMTFSFSLHPNHDLLYQDAVIEYVTDGSANLIEPLSTSSIFQGDVVERHQPVGWARLFDSDLTFEGTFTHPFGTFHVKSVRNYQISRRDTDVYVPPPSQREMKHWFSNMILFKDGESKFSMPNSIAAKQMSEQCFAEESTTSFHSDDKLKDDSDLSKRDGSSHDHFGCSLIDNTDAYNQYLADIAKMEEQEGRHVYRRAPSGCPGSKRVVSIGAVADCTYIRHYGSTADALKAILSNFNSASKVFESTFNVQLGLSRVMMQQTCTPNDTSLLFNRECSDSYTISNRLSDFSRWRGQRSDDGLGLWHLMTKCSTQPSVGIAWLGMLCATTAYTQNSGSSTQYVTGAAVSSIVPIEWKVVVHEIGHNFGAMHDCSKSTCPCSGNSADACGCCPCTGCDCDGKYLMHPLDTATTDEFSPCTQTQICSRYPTLGRCLGDPSSFVGVSSGICGNGIKEANEECDCGLPSECKSPCCDATTCKLKAGAKCSDSNDECCANCQPKSAGTLCHASTGPCDTNKMCDGVNVTCASDTYLPDGTSCTTSLNQSAQCTSGICTSRDLQCVGNAPVNTVSACPAFVTSCNLYCQDRTGTCYLLNGFFLDGTSCGITGKCVKGVCVGANPLSIAWQWILTNPQVSIPLIVFGAGVLFCCLYACCRCCCCKGSKKPSKMTTFQQSNQVGRDRAGSSSNNSTNTAGWVDPALYNGDIIVEDYDRGRSTAFADSVSRSGLSPTRRGRQTGSPTRPASAASSSMSYQQQQRQNGTSSQMRSSQQSNTRQSQSPRFDIVQIPPSSLT